MTTKLRRRKSMIYCQLCTIDSRRRDQIQHRGHDILNPQDGGQYPDIILRSFKPELVKCALDICNHVCSRRWAQNYSITAYARLCIHPGRGTRKSHERMLGRRICRPTCRSSNGCCRAHIHNAAVCVLRQEMGYASSYEMHRAVNIDGEAATPVVIGGIASGSCIDIRWVWRRVA